MAEALSPSRRRALVPRVTDHALDRYREHHPDATPEALLDALYEGTDAERHLVLPLVGRRPEHGGTGAYVISPDRRGLFVIDAGRCGLTLVTYLRFGAHAAESARRIWP